MHEERAAIDELGLELREFDGPAVPDGPRRWYRGEGVIAWSATEARIRDECAGARVAHPLAPRIARASARAIAFVGTGQEVDSIEALVASVPREIEMVRGAIGELLGSLGAHVSIARALGRAIGRSAADRLLATSIGPIAIARGPILGGIDPRWIRAGEGQSAALAMGTGGAQPVALSMRGGEAQPIALSMRRAQERGWAALDLAAAEIAGLADLREAHTELGGAELAYDLALLAIALREQVLARTPGALAKAREVASRLAPRSASPDRVRVAISGPAWLPLDRWEGELPIAEARRIVRELGGAAIGGELVRVRSDPAIRAGRAAPFWRPRSERRRELFSRWEQGIRLDDEGLYSATPEALANAIARGAHGVAIDATCGAGSISIALARRREVNRVIAIDRDADRLEMARHNAAIYGVADRIEFLHADALERVPHLRGDVLVIDPPWGGRGYDRDRMGLEDLPMLAPLLACFAGPITLKLPRSFAVSELGAGWSIEAGIDRRNVIKLLIARRGASCPDPRDAERSAAGEP